MSKTPRVFASLVDVAKAPEGTVLRRGIWFTYDLDLDVVARHILPAMVETVVEDQTERLRRTAAFDGGDDGGPPRLAIVADGRRLHSGPGVPWLRILPVHGRPQHAKFGVLEFTAPTGRKRVRRAFVSSANLTRGGTSTNHEILIVEEVTTNTKKPTLFGDLTAAIRDFAESSGEGELRPTDRQHLLELLHQIGFGIPAGKVVHSLDNTRALLPPSPAAERIDIVSPAFATNNDAKVIDLLRKAGMSKKTPVRWVLGAEDPDAPTVPKLLWNALEGQPEFECSVVPEGPGRSAPGRKLHAKAIHIHKHGGVAVFAGSANLTARGLGGLNRELMVGYPLTYLAAEESIEDLHGQPFTGRVPRWNRATSPFVDTSPTKLPELTVHHARSDGNGVLRGTLELRTPTGLKVTSVVLGGRRHRPDDLSNVRLGAGLAVVTGTIRGRTVKVTVPIDLSMVEPELWLWKSERRTDADPELDLILGVIRQAAERNEVRKSKQPNIPGAPSAAKLGKDDKYLEKLAQPLVMLARHREGLRRRLDEHALVAALDEFERLPLEKWNPAVERPIAEVLLGKTGTHGSALLAALENAR